MRRGREELRMVQPDSPPGLRLNAAGFKAPRPDAPSAARLPVGSVVRAPQLPLTPLPTVRCGAGPDQELLLLLPGLPVVIISGALAGLTGTVVKLCEGQRVLISPAGAAPGMFLEIDQGWISGAV